MTRKALFGLAVGTALGYFFGRSRPEPLVHRIVVNPFLTDNDAWFLGVDYGVDANKPFLTMHQYDGSSYRKAT